MVLNYKQFSLNENRIINTTDIMKEFALDHSYIKDIKEICYWSNN